VIPAGHCRDHRRGRRLGMWMLDPVLSGNGIIAHQAPRGVCWRWIWAPRWIDWLVLKSHLASLRREIDRARASVRAA
jgi:hypothetical protein